MGPSGAVLASGWTVLAPLAYGLRGDAAVLGQHAGILGERAISAQTAGMVRVFGWTASISGPPAGDATTVAIKPPGTVRPAPRSLNALGPNNVPLPDN